MTKKKHKPCRSKLSAENRFSPPRKSTFHSAKQIIIHAKRDYHSAAGGLSFARRATNPYGGSPCYLYLSPPPSSALCSCNISFTRKRAFQISNTARRSPRARSLRAMTSISTRRYETSARFRFPISRSIPIFPRGSSSLCLNHRCTIRAEFSPKISRDGKRKGSEPSSIPRRYSRFSFSDPTPASAAVGGLPAKSAATMFFRAFLQPQATYSALAFIQNLSSFQIRTKTDFQKWSSSSVAVVQLLSCVQLFVTPWTAAHQASVLHYLLEFAQIHGHRVSDAI